jgi:predicted GNAT superfamily acetyltransferase
MVEGMSEVRVEEAASLKDLEAVCRLQVATWSESTSVPLPMLVVAVEAGGIVLVARHREEIVGFCLGVPAYDGRTLWLWSHMAAVSAAWQGKGVGTLLKRRQRDVARRFGYPLITWTFDPLEARNAHFNLVRLGAMATAFFPNHYGAMDDPLNRGLPTDRLLAAWWVDDVARPAVPEASVPVTLLAARATAGGRVEPRLAETVSAVPVGDGRTVELLRAPSPPGAASGGGVLAVEVPLDFQELKREDPGLARAWRDATRAAFLHAFGRGAVAVGFESRREDGVGRYLLVGGDVR